MPTRAIARIFDLQWKKVRHDLTDGDAIWTGRREHRRVDDDMHARLLEEVTQNIQNRASVN
jgi:hypothetical protein